MQIIRVTPHHIHSLVSRAESIEAPRSPSGKVMPVLSTAVSLDLLCHPVQYKTTFINSCHQPKILVSQLSSPTSQTRPNLKSKRSSSAATSPTSTTSTPSFKKAHSCAAVNRRHGLSRNVRPSSVAPSNSPGSTLPW